MKFKHLAVTAALLISGAVHAADGTLALAGTTFSSIAADGADEWLLNLTTPVAGAITAFSTSGGGLTGVSFTLASGAQVPIMVTSSFLPYGTSFAFGNLAAGSYKLTVSGIAGKGYGISTATTPTTPVPESSAPALALAGLGLVALVMRRRAA
jgi:uncharacterized protein (TIGR03382 family)